MTIDIEVLEQESGPAARVSQAESGEGEVVTAETRDTLTRGHSSDPMDETPLEPQAEDQDSEAEPAAEHHQDTPKHKSAQRRIDKAVAAQRHAEAERDRALAELEQARGGKQEAAPAEEKEPDFYDFESVEAYSKAMREWASRQSTQSVEPVEDRSMDRAVALVMRAGARKHQDFDELVRSEELALTVDMVEEILDCDHPDDLLYHLGTHPDEAAGIAEMPKREMIRALMRLDARVGDPQPEKPRPTPRLSKAPEPATPTSGAGVRASPTLESMSFEEYSQQRRKEMASHGYR